MPLERKLPDPLNVISTLSLVGPYAGVGTISGPPTSGTIAAAGRVTLIPFRLARRFLVTQIFWMNGATAAGNVDAGVYSAPVGANTTAVRLVSTGATAQAGINAIQSVDVTDTWIGPGLFFLAITSDSGSTTFMRNQVSQNFDALLGGAQVAGQNTLPATLTIATRVGGAGNQPLVALTSKTVI